MSDWDSLRSAIGKLRESGITGWSIGAAAADHATTYTKWLEDIGAPCPKIASMEDEYLTLVWQGADRWYVTIDEEGNGSLMSLSSSVLQRQSAA